MSGFEGSSFQNPSDHEIKKFEITGWEIVPYVPQKFDSTSNLLKEKEAQHHAQLVKILKKMVTVSIIIIMSCYYTCYDVFKDLLLFFFFPIYLLLAICMKC